MSYIMEYFMKNRRMKNEEIYEKINDYTLSVVTDFGRMYSADPELRRIFNFRAQQVTTIYSMRYSQTVSSNMHIQNFSEFDSLDEVEQMRKKLLEMNGTPPLVGEPLRRMPGKP